MKKFLIIPPSSDFNRGDQALVLETKRLAEDAGFIGDYIMLDNPEPTIQIQNEGINVTSPILDHPSRNFNSKNNINYGKILKIKWSIIGIFDLLNSLYILLTTKYRWLPSFFISEKKKKTLQTYRDCDAIFVKGGGFLHAYGEITAWYFIYYNIYHMLLAFTHNKPLYIFPNSIGPLDGFFVKPMMKYVFKKAKIVMVRESISHEYIKKEFGIDTILTPDLGFYLEKDLEFNAVEYLVKNNIPIKNKKCVAITVRPYRFPGEKNGKELYENYLNKMVSFCQYLISENYYPVFVQQTLSNNAHEDDSKSIEEIITYLNKSDYGKIYDSSLNCRQLKSIYSEFSFVIGTRFHSVIFSLSSGIPSLALAYGGNKSKGIMQDLNLDDYVMEMGDIKLEDLIEKFTYLNNEYPKIVKHIEKEIEKIFQKREDLISTLN